MFTHHRESIDRVTQLLKQREEVLAILISGSVAHNFAQESSDVDLMIIIPAEKYRERKAAGDLHYYDTESATYEGGYIDGKFISTAFMEEVSLKGSEPARFAFEGTWASYSKLDNLESLLQKIAQYPVEKKTDNISRFHAQLEAWKWYCDEAIKHGNRYLLNHSVSNLILFGGRMILAHNEQLYPYHKWFLTVLENCPEKPSSIMDCVKLLLEAPTKDMVESFYSCIMEFRTWENLAESWPNIFMRDSELNWMHGQVAVADI